jgi:alkyl hydroperoxide reductase subunit AhpC
MGVSVDEDKDKEKWQNMIAEKGMKGIQLFASGWKTTIAEAYNISSIPRFILIDREGKILNATAERPSENIAEILTTLDGI